MRPALESMRRRLTLATHRIRTLPVVVLMPHSRCNCRCVMCDIWKANRNGQEISPAALTPHVDTLRSLNVRHVVLSGGEALMHPNLWALCGLLEPLGARITLLSTGLLLAPHAREVVRGCDDVIVSLDGSREVHDAIRRTPLAFDRLADGVAALKAIEPDFPVTARCVIQKSNYRDLPGIIAAARDIGLDGISFLAVDASSSAFNRPEPWTGDRAADVTLDERETAELERILEETLVDQAEAFESGFVAEGPDKMRRIPAHFAALNGAGDFPRNVCNAPWVSTVIEADGTVRPCFFHRALGNLHDDSLEKILNAPDAIAFRRNLDVARDPICRKCVCTLYLGPRAATS